ncbi:hypothetical protein ZIOFF_045420 [Zingiber officinale]|uniref:Uncharacterized protein n=1 Tax=Zingiber officinale TaxID=94328 RepID=A0A8J5G3S8_ZINOF|nr:hypothetical protein ZIOFF_045420 [Zingiber officinale]
MVRGRRQIPAFGNWDYSDGLPIIQRFESTDGELVQYEAAAAPVKPVVYQKKVWNSTRAPSSASGIVLKDILGSLNCSFQVRKEERGEEGKQRACEARVATERMPRRAPKAVDEDLYKIPPELICRKPKRASIGDCGHLVWASAVLPSRFV